jgi:hypothetical protein
VEDDPVEQGRTWKARRLKLVALLTLCIAIGAGIGGSPAGAHVGGTIEHIWNHLKPKADKRYVNQKQALWAVVNSNGTLARGSGVTAVVNDSAANKRVYFSRDVRGCAFSATIGLASNGGVEGAGFITVAGTGSDGPQGQPFQIGVFVRTTSVANTEATRGFHLQVTCSKVANAVPEVSARFGSSARRGGPNSR